MKKTILFMAVACLLLLNCGGVPRAIAAGDNTISLISVDKSCLVVSAPENRVIAFEDLSCNVVDLALISSGSFDDKARATSRIEWNVLGQRIMVADTAYTMESGETVTINCTYSPRSADLDFGLITQDGMFHFTTGSNGSIQTTIRVNETGKYYFAVRNNTGMAVEVLGYVYY